MERRTHRRRSHRDTTPGKLSSAGLAALQEAMDHGRGCMCDECTFQDIAGWAGDADRKGGKPMRKPKIYAGTEETCDTASYTTELSSGRNEGRASSRPRRSGKKPSRSSRPEQLSSPDTLARDLQDMQLATYRDPRPKIRGTLNVSESESSSDSVSTSGSIYGDIMEYSPETRRAKARTERNPTSYERSDYAGKSGHPEYASIKGHHRRARTDRSTRDTSQPRRKSRKSSHRSKGRDPTDRDRETEAGPSRRETEYYESKYGTSARSIPGDGDTRDLSRALTRIERGQYTYARSPSRSPSHSRRRRSRQSPSGALVRTTDTTVIERSSGPTGLLLERGELFTPRDPTLPMRFQPSHS